MRNGAMATELSAITSHIRLLRTRRCLYNCPIIAIVEGNLDQIRAREISDHVTKRLPSDCGDVRTIQTIIKGVSCPYAWLSGRANHSKEMLAMRFTDLLSRYAVLIFEDFVTDERVNGTKQSVLDKLKEALLFFHVVSKEASSLSINGKSVMTGKKNGQQDDLVMALLVGSYWGAAYEYKAYFDEQRGMINRREMGDVDMTIAARLVDMSPYA